MAIGRGSGENRAKEAAEQAIHSSLLDVSIDGARSILFNIKGGDDLSLYEVNEAAEIVRANSHPEANIIFGAVIDPEMKDEVHLTVIATGFDKSEPQDALSFAQSALEARTTSKPQSPQPQQPQPQPTDYNVRSFERDNLDIPAFLRKSRTNGR